MRPSGQQRAGLRIQNALDSTQARPVKASILGVRTNQPIKGAPYEPLQFTTHPAAGKSQVQLIFRVETVIRSHA
jgi:hypothetical protein